MRDVAGETYYVWIEQLFTECKSCYHGNSNDITMVYLRKKKYMINSYHNNIRK